MGAESSRIEPIVGDVLWNGDCKSHAGKVDRTGRP
jgi:hypothetical protein